MTNLDAVRAAAKARAITLAAGAAKAPAAVAAAKLAEPAATPLAVVEVPVAPPKAVSWPPARAASTPAPASAVPLPIAAKVTADSPPAPAKLQQFNVRLTPDAKARLHGAALACQLSDQEFLERWAKQLPEPSGRPPLPWERPDRRD